MDTRTRKAVGSLGLLVYLALYAAAAATLGSALAASWPTWAQLIYFAVAGVVWVLPLRPLFRWMNRSGG
jgi:membrane protein implicated in regulation of membrane protease activity